MAKKKNLQAGLLDELESIAEIGRGARLYRPAVGRILAGKTPTVADLRDAKMALKLLHQSVRARNDRSKLANKLAREGKAWESLELLK